ncbi:MAG: phosphoglycerate kinase [Euryarchaeota archaeon]|nr:phosphoglycerate kinase [Euryarchaeota archaeon]
MAQKDYLTLDDLDVDGKTVIVRVDVNSPLDKQTLEISSAARIRAIEPTIRRLLDRKARLVIIAHQGKKGDWDFCPLDRHVAVLNRELGLDVKFVPDLFGERAKAAIRALRPGEAVMLDNVRGWEGETAKKTPEDLSRSELVAGLAPLAQFFVNDAFAAAHRAQASLVGFPLVLPGAAGVLMDAEVSAMSRVFKDPQRPFSVILGGAKFSDATALISHLLDNKIADRVILTGLVPMAFLKAQGRNLGKPTEELLAKEPDSVKQAADILKKHPTKVILPDGFAADEGGKRRETPLGKLPVDLPLLDIDTASQARFARLISESKTVFVSGPAGLFERAPFDQGTAAVLTAIAASGAFRVAGGGHTGSAIDKLGLRQRFDYVSTGGGALEEFILGKKLPGVEALKLSKAKFGK